MKGKDGIWICNRVKKLKRLDGYSFSVINNRRSRRPLRNVSIYISSARINRTGMGGKSKASEIVVRCFLKREKKQVVCTLAICCLSGLLFPIAAFANTSYYSAAYKIFRTEGMSLVMYHCYAGKTYWNSLNMSYWSPVAIQERRNNWWRRLNGEALAATEAALTSVMREQCPQVW